MADKKISALTASATPLAGTEVLPIVQSGSTVKVSVANLTAGRAVSASSLTASTDNIIIGTTAKGVTTGSAIPLGLGVNNTVSAITIDTLSNVGVGTTTPVDFSIYGYGPTVESRGGRGGSFVTSSSDAAVRGVFAVDNTISILNIKTVTNHPIVFGVNDVAYWRLNPSGNLAPSIAGNGIDFSANTHAAGMTSELLNDYEEGTYTVAIGCGTSGTVTLNTAYDTAQYTKVGRLVTVTGGVIVSSVLLPLGYFTISLPFTSASLSELSGYFLSVLTISGVNTANIADFVSLGVTGASSIRVYLGDATGLQGDSAQELKANTEIYFTVSYIAA